MLKTTYDACDNKEVESFYIDRTMNINLDSCIAHYISETRQNVKKYLMKSSIHDSFREDDIPFTEHDICEKVSVFVENSILCNGSTFSIASLVFYLYNSIFKVARLKTKEWYIFDGSRWRSSEIGPYFELSSDIVDVYEYHVIKLLSRARILENNEIIDTDRSKETEIAKMYENIERCKKIIEKLKNVNSKENICKECVYLFYDQSFSVIMDTNPSIVCFRNGVLDLTSNEFRKCVSSDNVTIMIDLEFIFPRNKKEKNKFNDILEEFHQFRRRIVARRKTCLLYTPSLT
jgi:hypothetical protein